jgi:hypothetical protein
MSGAKLVAFVALVTALGLAGCGEKAQTVGSRKADVAAYQGTDNGYAAAGWKAGDKTSWEQQLQQRSQGQNENSRAAAQ